MISVVIPTFGNIKRVTTLLRSLERFESAYEVIIVNDDPAHPLTGFNKKYTVLQNQKNSGFAFSVNRGLTQAKGDILLLLNDDVVLTSKTFDKIEAAFKRDLQIGILGALLYYPDRRIQHGGMFFDEKLKSFLHKKAGPIESRYVISTTGAFFAITRECYTTLGGLDESYFLACEDTKYCLNAWEKGFRVYFDKTISAIHAEGATRGKSPGQKLKFPKWTKLEREGIARFKAGLDLGVVKKLQEEVDELNYVPKKIEIGSGYNPHPGYLHLDIRKGLPQLDYVCDFVSEKLPFKDKEVEEILANHVIEHIPYRKLPFVIGEWVRVLREGGKLVLRTPNLRFICEKYLKGETTPEWPGDEKFIKDNLSDEVTPAWWANIKLFSGQDYAANFHHVCFDFEMLYELLCRCGFSTVHPGRFDREFSPGELQVEAYKGIEGIPIYAGARRKKSCCVIRDGAMGDVILTTSIIERLAKEYEIIDVITKCQDVFRSNPHVRTKSGVLAEFKRVTYPYDRFIDLNLAYEKRPKMHIIDAYSLVAFGDTNTPHKTNLYAPPHPKEDYICIHMAKSWENRTWSEKNWNILQVLLSSRLSTKFVLVGAKNDFTIQYIPVSDPFASINLVGKQTFWELVETIQKSKLFIGMDSGPLHIAQAVGTEAIGLFTCAKAEYRATGNLRVISPDIDCYGCLHDVKPPVTYCGCRRGDFKCLDLITPEMVYEGVKEVLK